MTQDSTDLPDYATEPDASWLKALPDHPIFSTSSASTASSAPPGRILLRGSDAILFADGQLRLTSLNSLKDSTHANDKATSSSRPAHSYKILANTLLDETLSGASANSPVALSLNPARTLLAVWTHTSLILVILPRSTSLASSSSSVHVKAHRIGSFYVNAHTPKSEHIVCAKWHPWSGRGTSLLLLLRDGTLTEYDVARDLAEPQQSVAMLPRRQRLSSPRVGHASRRGISLGMDDSDEEIDGTQEAVAFTLGIDGKGASPGRIQGDWTPLSVYALTKSGDVFAITPFLPRFAYLSTQFIQALASSIPSKENSRPKGRQEANTLRFVSHLLKQARLAQNAKVTGSETDPPLGMRERATTPAEILRQQSRSVSAVSPAHNMLTKSQSAMSLDSLGQDVRDDQDEDQTESEVDLVEVESFNDASVQASPTSQGPFLVVPAPHELSDSREPQGSDIAYIRLAPPRAIRGGQHPSCIELILVAGDDGRVDVGVLNIAGKISPRWTVSSSASVASSRNRDLAPQHLSWRVSSRATQKKSGRYGLSDSSDEESESRDIEEADETLPSGRAASLPTLFIYESLDLGLGHHAPGSSPVGLVIDPVYQDTFYVNHHEGAHMICMSPWAGQFARLLSTEDTEGTRRFLHQEVRSQVRWIVKLQGDALPSKALRGGISAIEIVDDVYLGYSLLVLLGDGECLGIEMNLRSATRTTVDELEHKDREGASASSPSDRRQLYTSLLGAEPFSAPAPFQQTPAPFPSIRLKSSDPSVGRREIQVTPESLRLLGSTVQDLRSKLREVVQGGNAVQSRLDLQIRELQRQVTKLNDVRLRTESRHSASAHSERLARVSERQRKLVQRVDRVLQRSMDASQTGMSQYEDAWLKEMERMEKEMGAERGEGLQGRMDKLRAQLEQLKPDLVRLNRESSIAGVANAQFGEKQLNKLLGALAQESDRLLEAKGKVQDLNRVVARSHRTASVGGGFD